MPKCERECRMLYCYTENLDENVFFSEYLFATDAQNNYFFIYYDDKIIDIYVPNINYEVEIGG